VGYWDGPRLHYASHVGSGFDDAKLAAVQKKLDPLKTKACPFVEKPDLHSPTVWVEPEMVAEVKFQEWTKDGFLRAPVFLRLREDIDPKSVRRSERTRVSEKARAGSEIDDIVAQLEKLKSSGTISVGKHSLKLSHLDRVYWPADPALKQPALTKRDLLRYFARVSPFMLPHLADRPLTMIRMPDGINGQRFYQKHWAQERPEFAETITVFSEHKDESHDYLLCNNLPTLLWLAQSGTLEFHVWHSRARLGSDSPVKSTDYASSLDSLERSVLNYPDYVVFALAPYIYSGKEAPGAAPALNTVALE
jgi:bifunctional non-homologous end joining protein LigD